MVILERLLNRSQETNPSKVQFLFYSYNPRKYNTVYVIILLRNTFIVKRKRFTYKEFNEQQASFENILNSLIQSITLK